MELRNHRTAQTLNGVTALDDRLLGCIDGAVHGRERLFTAFGKHVPGGLKFDKRGLKALQKRVVQVARDARTLVDTRRPGAR